MALAAVSNHGSWSAQASETFQALPSVVLPRAPKIVSSLPAISTNIEPSAQSPSPSSSASTSSASDSAVPQSVLDALSSYVSPTQQAWNTLTQSLRLGDLPSAQSALADYTASLSAPKNSSMLEATTPSDTFVADLKAVGDALAAGSLEDARAAFSAATVQRPDTAAEAVSSAQDAASQDGWFAEYTLEHPGSGAINQASLANDIAAVDGALREEQADISEELVALGYSKSDANKYAEAITGIGNASAGDNAQVDPTRATQWIQGLISAAQSAVASHGPTDQVAYDLTSNPATLLTRLEFGTIDGWRQLETLIESTLNPASASAGTPSGGVSLHAVA